MVVVVVVCAVDTTVVGISVLSEIDFRVDVKVGVEILVVLPGILLGVVDVSAESVASSLKPVVEADTAVLLSAVGVFSDTLVFSVALLSVLVISPLFSAEFVLDVFVVSVPLLNSSELSLESSDDSELSLSSSESFAGQSQRLSFSVNSNSPGHCMSTGPYGVHE